MDIDSPRLRWLRAGLIDSEVSDVKGQSRQTRASWLLDKQRARQIGGPLAAAVRAKREADQRRRKGEPELPSLFLPYDGAPVWDDRE